MSATSAIEWTNSTWNPTTGCDRVSPGCDHCYALTMAKRLKAMGVARYQNDGDPRTSGPGFAPTTQEAALLEPFGWRKPRRVFVNSMSDLFHQAFPDAFLARVFAVMQLTPQHTYQVLTKRHGRMHSLLNKREFLGAVDDAREQIRPGCGDFEWPIPGVWLGVSVENQKYAGLRIPKLLETPAAVRFLSCEPLLGALDLSQWLGGGGCGCDSVPGGPDLPSDRVWPADDRFSRSRVAGGHTTPQSVEPADAHNGVHAAAGGKLDGHLPAGTRNDRRNADSCPGASPGVETFLRADTARADGQPQERGQVGQPARQPGTGNHAGATDPRAEGFAARSPESVGPAESDGEADDRAGAGNLRAPGERRVDPCPRCGLRRPGADDLAYRARGSAISWLIAGGESGVGARPVEPGWIRSLRDQCAAADVPFFFKQWGGSTSKAGGRELDGAVHDGFPQTAGCRA